MARPKDVAAATLLFLFAGYAAYRELQALAIVCLAGLLAVIYQHPVRRFVEQATVLFKGTRQAKLGNFELHVDNKLDDLDLSAILSGREAFFTALTSQLGSDHIGILLEIAHAQRLPPVPAKIERLRELRNRGLLAHDEPSLASSREVWLTPVGAELARAIIGQSTTSHIASPPESGPEEPPPQPPA